MTEGILTIASQEQEELALELQTLFGQLGILASTPAINQLAEKRRQRALQTCRQEIARLQQIQADITRDLA